MTRLLALLFLVFGAAPALAEPYGTGDFSHKDWRSYCTGRNGCEMGTQVNESPIGYLSMQIVRGWQPEDAPILSFYLSADAHKQLEERGAQIAFEVDGKQLARVDYQAFDQNQYGAFLLPTELGQTLLEAMVKGTSLSVLLLTQPDPPVATLSLAGLSANLRFVDEFQGRADTPTAIVAKGKTPMIATVSPTLYPKTIEELPAPVRAAWQASPWCADIREGLFESVAEGHEVDDYMVWILPCGDPGAYNLITSVYVHFKDETDQPATRISFPFPVGDGLVGTDDTLVNPFYDRKTKSLTSFFKGRGLGDCGLWAEHVFIGGGFALKTARQKDDCDGNFIPLEEWPQTFPSQKQ